MKYTITTLLLLSVIFSNGQSTKRTPGDIEPYGIDGNELPDRDTMKVIMLATEKIILQKGQDVGYETSIRYLGFSFQIDGYVVRKRQSDQHHESFWMEPVFYMDKHKKRLPSTFIIWQVKEDSKP